MMRAMVNGIDSIEDKNVRLAVEEEIRKYAANDFNINDILEGIPDVDFVKGTIPDSGFFELLDFTKLKNKEYGGRVITDEVELLKYLFEQEKVKLILGRSISWPNEDEIIGRVTTALPRYAIVDHMGAVNKSLRKLR